MWENFSCPWAGLGSLVDGPHSLQKGWQRVFREMRTGRVSWAQAHSIPHGCPSQPEVKMKDQQLPAFHHGETSLPVRCRCLSITTRHRRPFSSERGNHSVRSCCAQTLRFEFTQPGLVSKQVLPPNTAQSSQPGVIFCRIPMFYDHPVTSAVEHPWAGPLNLLCQEEYETYLYPAVIGRTQELFQLSHHIWLHFFQRTIPFLRNCWTGQTKASRRLIFCQTTVSKKSLCRRHTRKKGT